MSIGYKTILEKVEDGVRYLKELQLFEGSLVGMGMNNLANVTTAKQMQDQNIALLLQQLKDSYKWLPSQGSRK